MATLIHMKESVDQPTWDIQKDAFAPPTTRRIIRGWDRAPVSARAPRLHGQKVWKKVVLRVGSTEDILDGPQDELEKEGAGARKKSRMLTARENINDAMWAEAIPVTCSLDIESDLVSNGDQIENSNNPVVTASNNSTAEIESITSVEAARGNLVKPDKAAVHLQLIPRKRTNTDHMVTPKKTLRQTTLEHKEPALSAPEPITKSSSKILRPRKSLRKSMTESTSDNTSNRRMSRSQSRLSSGTELLTNLDCIASLSKGTVTKGGDSNTKKRALRRSTISRANAPCIEVDSSASHHLLDSGKSDPQDQNLSITSIPAQLTPTEGTIDCTHVDEMVMNGEPNLIDSTNLDDNVLSDPANESLQYSLHVLPVTTNTQLPNAVDLQPPVGSFNVQIETKQVQESQADKDIPQSEISEGKDSLAVLGILAPSAIATWNEACQTTSSSEAVAATGGDGSSRKPDTILQPARTDGVSPFKVKDRVVPAKSGGSSNSLFELDVHSGTQDVEAPNASKASNTTMVYDHDDTDMLRNFLTRVKANKAAKNPPKRKRSLPHSPLRIPLGDMDNNASPSPLQLQKGIESDVAELSPSKRKKKSSPLAQYESELEPRRSGRTKPPVKEPPGAPSFIPVRRLGQDIDTTVTLKRNEEKELAALTRVNTRKNKANALTALEVLAKKSEEKEDPVMRQRLLKEVFDEKVEKGRQDKEKGREKKSVTWAEELVRFQSLTKDKEVEEAGEKDRGKGVVVPGGGEEKKTGAVRVGVRSKAALGMALNGTPAPKRKMRGRA